MLLPHGPAVGSLRDPPDHGAPRSSRPSSTAGDRRHRAGLPRGQPGAVPAAAPAVRGAPPPAGRPPGRHAAGPQGPAPITLTPTTAVPHNPSLEGDQAQGLCRRKGPAINEIALAATERAFPALFAPSRDAFSEGSDSGTVGPFAASDGGVPPGERRVDLRGDNTVRSLSSTSSGTRWQYPRIDLPNRLRRRGCIAPTPFGCALRLSMCALPRTTPTSRSPPPVSPAALGALVVARRWASTRSIPPGRRGWTTWTPRSRACRTSGSCASIRGASTWTCSTSPTSLVTCSRTPSTRRSTPVLIPSGVGARPRQGASSGPLIDVVRAPLDIPYDVPERLEDLLGTSLGLLDVLTTAVLDTSSRTPVLGIEDPYPMLAAALAHPRQDAGTGFDVHITDDEMVVTQPSAREEPAMINTQYRDPHRPRQRRADPARLGRPPRARAGAYRRVVLVTARRSPSSALSSRGGGRPQLDVDCRETAAPLQGRVLAAASGPDAGALARVATCCPTSARAGRRYAAVLNPGRGARRLP